MIAGYYQVLETGELMYLSPSVFAARCTYWTKVGIIYEISYASFIKDIKQRPETFQGLISIYDVLSNIRD